MTFHKMASFLLQIWLSGLNYYDYDCCCCCWAIYMLDYTWIESSSYLINIFAAIYAFCCWSAHFLAICTWSRFEKFTKSQCPFRRHDASSCLFWQKRVSKFTSPKINSCILVPNVFVLKDPVISDSRCYRFLFLFQNCFYLVNCIVMLVLYKIVENILHFQWSLWKFYSISGIWSIYIKFFILNFGADSFPFAI